MAGTGRYLSPTNFTNRMLARLSEFTFLAGVSNHLSRWSVVCTGLFFFNNILRGLQMPNTDDCEINLVKNEIRFYLFVFINRQSNHD